MNQPNLTSYLVVIDSSALGGMEVHTAQWVRLMAEAGHRVTVLQLGKDVLSDKLADTAAHVLHHAMDPSLGKKDEYLALGRILKKHRADVTVYARNGFAVVVLLALWRHSRRLVTIDHGIPGAIIHYNPRWRPPSRIKRWLSSLAIDHTLAVSEAVRQSAIEVWGVRPSRITTCYNWVDTQYHHPDDVSRHAHRTQHSLSADTFVVGSLGRLGADKRVTLLTEAFALFAKQYDGPCHLVLVGKGGELEKIRQIIGAHAMQDKVTLIDWTDDPAAWHRGFDMEVNLTLQEAFGLSAVEAMACGGIILAQGGSGVDEYVQHQTNGFLQDLPDVTTLSRWIMHIAKLSPAKCLAISQAARTTAVDRFSPQIALANLLMHLGSPQAAGLAREYGLNPRVTQA